MSELAAKLRQLGRDMLALDLDMKLPPGSANPEEAADEIDRLTKALETAREALEQLESAGAGMANMCFNLAQESYLPASVRQSMKTGQMQWDAAVRAIRAIKEGREE